MFTFGRAGAASLKANRAINTVASTMKADYKNAGRAYGSFMNHMAGGGKFSTGARTFGRDMMRDIGGKRLGMYGAGAAGVGATAWGVTGD